LPRPPKRRQACQTHRGIVYSYSEAVVVENRSGFLPRLQRKLSGEFISLDSLSLPLAASFAQACYPTLYLLNGHEINNSFSRNLGAQRCSKTKLDEFELPWMMRICAERHARSC
jgi:hypothetical protein